MPKSTGKIHQNQEYPLKKILISGLINIETTMQVDRFPIDYFPVRYPFFGVNTTLSGVGYNLVKALSNLGDCATLVSLTGGGFHSQEIFHVLAESQINSNYVLPLLKHTPQSVILYDPTGRRQINVDLKDIQSQSYPEEKFTEALNGSDIAVMCNINFSRKLLSRVKLAGIPLATDVHAISSIDDEYNQDFMTAADILFCSDELLPCSAEEWAERIHNRYGVKILVVGLGAKGAYLSARDSNIKARFPAVQIRPIVNTIGAGDALFSCFIHYYLATNDPIVSLRKAIIFASYKIGENGAANGLLTEHELESYISHLASW